MATDRPSAPGLFDPATFLCLSRDPAGEVSGTIDGIPYRARIAIENYADRIARYYERSLPDSLAAVCEENDIPFDLPQFGLVVEFDRAVDICVHDGDMVLDGSIGALVDRFGPVIFRNARMTGDIRAKFHRNIFPHLRFHVDRGPRMPNQYSCFTRDPSTPEQYAPRTSSTLFIANIVAWLEEARLSADDARPEAGVRTSYDIFHDGPTAPLLGDIVLEQPWTAPDGIGEICVIDNRTVLHATYNRDGQSRGYPIGARYLF